jgi:hypothetical protein
MNSKDFETLTPSEQRSVLWNEFVYGYKVKSIVDFINHDNACEVFHHWEQFHSPDEITSEILDEIHILESDLRYIMDEIIQNRLFSIKVAVVAELKGLIKDPETLMMLKATENILYANALAGIYEEIENRFRKLLKISNDLMDPPSLLVQDTEPPTDTEIMAPDWLDEQFGSREA